MTQERCWCGHEKMVHRDGSCVPCDVRGVWRPHDFEPIKTEKEEKPDESVTSRMVPNTKSVEASDSPKLADTSEDNFSYRLVFAVLGWSILASFGTSIYFGAQNHGYAEATLTTVLALLGTLGFWLILWPFNCLIGGGPYIVPILSFGALPLAVYPFIYLSRKHAD